MQNALRNLGTFRAIQLVAEDVARVKATLRYPVTAVGYGADFFVNEDQSDKGDAFQLGYNAAIMEGLRFPFEAENQFEISLFSANDPNATVINGVVLPKFTEILKFWTSLANSATTTLGIAQYGFQTVEMKQGYMSRSRIRYGGYVSESSSEIYYGEAGDTPTANLYDYTEWGQIVYPGYWIDPYNSAYGGARYGSYYIDTWKEPFMYAVTIDHVLNGAHVAQTFLSTNDAWITRLKFFIAAKGGASDIHVGLCEVTTGVPDLAKTMQKVVLPQASIVVGWNSVALPPTFLQKGKKYGVVLVSNANHQLGMTSGQSYLDGTFFYSTDGIYYAGDLTKDLMFQVNGCKFDNSQVAIEFAPISLSGGFRFVDILAELWAPDSTQLTWEMRPNGTGEWQALTKDNTTVLANAPPLAQFRARFDGTRDMQPALKLTGSRVKVSRPKTSFKHVSTDIVIGATSSSIHIKVWLEHFDETPHNHDCAIHINTVKELPDVITTKLLDDDFKRYEREYTFNIAAPATHFRVEQNGVTTNAQNTYHIAQRTFYAA